MIIRILNKAQYLKLFFFFAMGIVVGYELNAESFQTEKNINPFKLYPKDISFEVKRNEEIIGFHKVTFELITDNRISVVAEMKINVFFLGFQYTNIHIFPMPNGKTDTCKTWQQSKMMTGISRK